MSEVLNSTINNATENVVKQEDGLQVAPQAAASPARQIYLGYDDETKREVDKFVRDFNIRDPEIVRNYASNCITKNTNFCDNYLDFACSTEAEKQVKDNLGKLIDQVSKNTPKKAGFFERLFMSAEQHQKKLKRKFQTVGDMVEEIEGELLSLEKDLLDARGDIRTFAEAAKSNLQLIDKYVVAGELILEEFEKTEVPKYKSRMMGASESEKITLKQEMESYQSDFLKQLNNLKTVKSIAIVTLMQLFEMAQENKLLYDNIHDSIIHTIPVWKQSCAIALLQAKHDVVADATVSVNKITEQMLIDNTERVGQGYISALKQSQEGFISVDVISTVTEQIKSTLEEAKKIQDDGFKKQQERSKALEAGQQSLLMLASSIDRELKITEVLSKANQLDSLAAADSTLKVS